jgi:tRNA threonylcarbamoyladenosine biosynthesis protein TsaE
LLLFSLCALWLDLRVIESPRTVHCTSSFRERPGEGRRPRLVPLYHSEYNTAQFSDLRPGVSVSLVSNPHVIDIISNSAAQTQRFGARLGELAQPGDLFCLEGELGAGKTCFVQGLGRGLAIPDDIRSPTFILANEHNGGRLTLHHLDVYRMHSAAEAIGIGLDDYVASDGVCVIEWADKVAAALPAERLWIAFRHVSEFKRGLVLSAVGARYSSLLDEFKASTFGQYDATSY